MFCFCFLDDLQLRIRDTNMPVSAVMDQSNNWGWNWLERWMAAKPWETRLMDKPAADPPKLTPPPPTSKHDSSKTKSFETNSVRVKRNNVTTRVSARPPMHMPTRYSSSPSSDYRCDESPVSSSFCTSATPNTNFTSERTDESCHMRPPSYMSLTESTKAKQRGSGGSKLKSKTNPRDQRQSGGLTYSDSVNFSRPLKENINY